MDIARAVTLPSEDPSVFSGSTGVVEAGATTFILGLGTGLELILKVETLKILRLG